MNLSNLNLPSDVRSRVESFAADYETHKKMLLRDGLTLRDYVQTCMAEFGMEPMGDALTAELDRLQSQYGQPSVNDGHWLSSQLNEHEAV